MIRLNISKKLVNRLIECGKQWIGKIDEVSKDKIEKALIEVLFEDYSNSELAMMNVRIPLVLESFLIPDQRLFDSLIGFTDLIKLAAMCVKDPRYLENVVVNIGIGGSINPTNVRVPVYLLPAVKILKSLELLRQNGIIEVLPKVRVFCAQKLASICNGFPMEQLWRTTVETFAYMHEYLSRFYPSITSQFLFDLDHEWMSDRDIIAFLERLKSIIKESDSQIVNECLKSIQVMGQKHGGIEGTGNAYLYAVAHPLYEQDMITIHSDKFLVSCSNGIAANPKAVIHIGGGAEKKFYSIRQFIVENTANFEETLYIPLTVQFFTKIGRVPVYYTARDGDLSLKEISLFTYQLRAEDHKAQKDLDVLIDEHDDRFLKFIKEFSASLPLNPFKREIYQMALMGNKIAINALSFMDNLNDYQLLYLIQGLRDEILEDGF